MSDPVLIVLLSSECSWCNYLLKNWDVTIQALLQVYPKLKFPSSNKDTKKYKYPPIIAENKSIDIYQYPKDLSNYIILWLPMIMLVPGDVWDKCNQQLGPYDKSKLENIQIMNGIYINDKLEYKQQWDIRKPEHFASWLSDALKNLNIEPKKYMDDGYKNDKKEIHETRCLNLLNLMSYY
jgi:hypothetical protein